MGANSKRVQVWLRWSQSKLVSWRGMIAADTWLIRYHRRHRLCSSTPRIKWQPKRDMRVTIHARPGDGAGRPLVLLIGLDADEIRLVGVGAWIQNDTDNLNNFACMSSSVNPSKMNMHVGALDTDRMRLVTAGTNIHYEEGLIGSKVKISYRYLLFLVKINLILGSSLTCNGETTCCLAVDVTCKSLQLRGR